MSEYRFAKWINKQLDRKGWRPADLADQAGIGRSAVSRWINEGYQPNIPNARAAAEALGVPLLEILVESEQLSVAEALMYSRARSLSEVSDEELAEEVRRRLVRPRRK
ncbi:helix-turn-helix domain-containing protein [Saccharopolyspora hattusasensis]|uniref:helix-turn-helix domain-containing protein n=1 Tax=Saccharopolyspora hattusasensis TaxID=1128679 RepID=UPI003D9668A2